MESPVVNMTGSVTINVMAPVTKSGRPSIPLTPFVQATMLDVRNELLIFNTFVEKELKNIDGVMTSEMMDILKNCVNHLEEVARGDYSPELLTEYGAKIAAAAAAFVIHYGGELSLK